MGPEHLTSQTRRIGDPSGFRAGLPAFLSSAFVANEGIGALLPQEIYAEPYEDLNGALEAWKELFINNNDEEITLPEDQSIQNLWDQPMYEQKYKQILDAQNSTEKHVF